MEANRSWRASIVWISSGGIALCWQTRATEVRLRGFFHNTGEWAHSLLYDCLAEEPASIDIFCSFCSGKLFWKMQQEMTCEAESVKIGMEQPGYRDFGLIKI